MFGRFSAAVARAVDPAHRAFAGFGEHFVRTET
jgi:hypothetical protein